MSNSGLPSKFIAFDLETTGLDAKKNEIIEIGAVLFENGVEIAEYSQLVKPKREVPRMITELTGIRNEDLKDSPRLAEVLPAFIEFVADYPIVAHNVRFDKTFIQNNLEKFSFPTLNNKFIDTLNLARLGMPGHTNYRLGTLAEAIGHDMGLAHRAVNDARACGVLFTKAVPGIIALDNSGKKSLAMLLDKQKTDTAVFVKELIGEIEIVSFEPKKLAPIADPLISKEEIEKVEALEIEQFFMDGGTLADNIEGYESRTGQMEMAEKVINAFNNQRFLSIEAGTGVGKSLSYLVPAILFSVNNNSRIIISTKTKTLQEQLFKKEVPFLKECLGIDFKASVLKGRNNYLCKRKFKEYLEGADTLLRDWETEEVMPLVPWASNTDNGDISECTFFNERQNRIIWAKICSDTHSCIGSKCAYYSSCFLMRKRREALSANVVFVNHALFFTDLKANGSLLGKYDRVIFDEAHTLVETGRKHLGDELNNLNISILLQKLVSRDEGGFGLLKRLKKRANKIEAQRKVELLELIDSLTKAIPIIEKSSAKFFRSLGVKLKKLKKGDKLRYKGDLENTITVNDDSPILGIATNMLRKITGILQEIMDENSNDLDEFIQDLDGVRKEMDYLSSMMDLLFEGKDENSVFWVEGSRQPINTKLVRAPLAIEKIMHKEFLTRMETAVFTSATMAVKDSLDYFNTSIGNLEEDDSRVDSEIISSPFDYPKQLLFGALKINVGATSDGYISNLATILDKLAVENKKRILVLFTSRDMMKKCYLHLIEEIKTDCTVLAQDITGGTIQVLEKFRSKPGSILLGTDSFWEGIDLPGDHLEILVLAKLPFAVPTEPVLQARGEDAQERGGNFFKEYYLPEAVIKFRQGIGRLIRRCDDKGIALVTDDRIVTKPYGSTFRKSVDTECISYTDLDSLYNDVKKHLE